MDFGLKRQRWLEAAHEKAANGVRLPKNPSRPSYRRPRRPRPLPPSPEALARLKAVEAIQRHYWTRVAAIQRLTTEVDQLHHALELLGANPFTSPVAR